MTTRYERLRAQVTELQHELSRVSNLPDLSELPADTVILFKHQFGSRWYSYAARLVIVSLSDGIGRPRLGATAKRMWYTTGPRTGGNAPRTDDELADFIGSQPVMVVTEVKPLDDMLASAEFKAERASRSGFDKDDSGLLGTGPDSYPY